MAETFRISSLTPSLLLRVKLKFYQDDSYPIVIEAGVLHNLPKHLTLLMFPKKICVVTDTNVRKLYGTKLLDTLRDAGFDATMISFQAGEGRKTMETVEKMANQMVQLGHNRKSAILTLGGGVVGDLGGFLASIFMRGIPFVHIPTTLMAMADSSIGGKTGVDLITGKNLVGTFQQPKAIYIDPELLGTLSKKQIKNGLAEIAKHGLIADRGILRLLRKFPQQVIGGDTALLTKLLKRSCRVKRKIVQQDVFESQKRMFLNYGHTIGHAIEHASGYALNHGEAVSIGMNLENRLAVDRGLLSAKNCEWIEELLKSLDLPTRIPEKIDRAPILKALGHDKKNGENGYTFTLLRRIKRPVIVEGVTETEVEAVL